MKFSILAFIVTLLVGIPGLTFAQGVLSGKFSSRLVTGAGIVALCFGLGALYALIANWKRDRDSRSAALYGALVVLVSLLIAYYFWAVLTVQIAEVFAQVESAMGGTSVQPLVTDSWRVYQNILLVYWPALLLGVLAGAGGGLGAAALVGRPAEAAVKAPHAAGSASGAAHQPARQPARVSAQGRTSGQQAAPAAVSPPLAPAASVSPEREARRERMPSPAAAAAEPGEQAGDIRFVKETTEQREALVDGQTQKVTTTYLLYKADSLEAAMRFLSQTPVSDPHITLEVETPEGKFGQDINGIYIG